MHARLMFSMVLCGLTSLTAHADIVSNGSFELNDVPNTGYTDVGQGGVPSWVLTESDSFQISLFDRDDITAPDGDQQLVFNASNTPAGASIHQVLTTVENGIYEVLFVTRANLPSSSSVESRILDGAGLGGTLIESESASVGTLVSNIETGFTFVANSTTTTIAFIDDSPTSVGSDLFLDNVRVTFIGIPEPCSSPILFAITGFFGLSRRRV